MDLKIEDLIQSLMEELGVSTLDFHSYSYIYFDSERIRVCWIIIDGYHRSICINGTTVFICGPDKCQHSQKHSVDIKDPDSISIIKGWISYLKADIANKKTN